MTDKDKELSDFVEDFLNKHPMKPKTHWRVMMNKSDASTFAEIEEGLHDFVLEALDSNLDKYFVMGYLTAMDSVITYAKRQETRNVNYDKDSNKTNVSFRKTFSFLNDIKDEDYKKAVRNSSPPKTHFKMERTMSEFEKIYGTV